MSQEIHKDPIKDIRNRRQVEHRIQIGCRISLQTPAHLGSGEMDELTDMPLLTDTADNHPYRVWIGQTQEATPKALLTGASLTGALRAYLQTRQFGYAIGLDDIALKGWKSAVENSGNLATLLFDGQIEIQSGTQPKTLEITQSALIIEDTISAAQIILREGVAIDAKSGTASDGALYNRQCWAEGATFDLRFELVLTVEDDKLRQEALKQATISALLGLEEGKIRLGGRKTRGYGKIKVESWYCKSYNLKHKNDLVAWLQSDQLEFEAQTESNFDKLKILLGEPIADKRHFVEIEAELKLAHRIMIRGRKPLSKNDPDVSMLTNSKKEALVTGTSMAGALRQRATRIAILKRNADMAKSLFGHQSGDKGQASRLIVEESILTNVETNRVQVRNRIDPFTGGTVDTALFGIAPAFTAKRDDPNLTLRLMVKNPTEKEIALLLYVLKDIWLEDLPVGGEKAIGSGRFIGHRATITIHDKGTKKIIELNKTGLANPNESRLIVASYQNALNENISKAA